MTTHIMNPSTTHFGPSSERLETLCGEYVTPNRLSGLVGEVTCAGCLALRPTEETPS